MSEQEKAPPQAPLGPNDVVPVAAGSEGDKPYEYQAWPAWRYDPETGKGQIFESADEVPEGWGDLPPTATAAGEEPVVVDESLLGEGAGAGEGGGANGGTDDQSGQDGGDNGEGAGGDPEWTKDELVALGQAKLAEILDARNATLKTGGEDEIEFLPNWPKVKLADAILDNGGYRAPKEA